MPSKPSSKDKERRTARRVLSDEERKITLPDGSTRALRVDLSVLANIEEKYGSWREVALSFIRDDKIVPMLDVLKWSAGLDGDSDLSGVSIGDFEPETFATVYNVMLRDVGVAPDGDDDDEEAADTAGDDPSPPGQGTPPI